MTYRLIEKQSFQFIRLRFGFTILRDRIWSAATATVREAHAIYAHYARSICSVRCRFACGPPLASACVFAIICIDQSIRQ